jgi:hypothetical protein
MNVETRDERLRRLLRETDAARTEPGLTSEEIHEMRRTVLTAIPERRRFLLSPLLAGAAMAVLAAVAVLLLWPRPERTPPPPAPPRIAVKEPAKDVKRTDVERPAVRTETNRRTRAAAAGLRARRPAPSTPGASSAGERIAAANEPETESRQIQFDTPGGTRVIWILTANNAL